MLETIDFVSIGLYFVLVFVIAGYVTYQERKVSGGTTSGYFLGGRNTGWFVIGASLFASNIGSEHLVGLAGAGAAGGFPAAQFEVLAALILVVLGWVFVPFYLKSGVFTMPEFLEKRYNRGARDYLSWLSILAYVLTKISVTIAAGGIVFTTILGIDFWTGALVIVITTGIYTVFGGLKAVIYTDMIQMFVLIGGSIAVTIFGLMALGSPEPVAGGLDIWNGSVSAGMANLQQAAVDNEGLLSLWRGIEDADYPLLGILLGAPILGVWYWCTDQFIVQRVLAAKDIHHARKGTLFGGFLKLLPLFLFVIPGAIAFAIQSNVNLGELPGAVLDPETGKWIANGIQYNFGLLNETIDIQAGGEMIKHVMVTKNDAGTLVPKTQPDGALPAMIIYLLPAGIKGLVVSGLLAALMSSLSSVFNSCSTLFTIDIYKRYKPNTKERELVIVGQIATVVLVALGLLWIPFMDMIEGGLFKKLQSIQAYISPPIAAVFLFGILNRRLNGKGALASLFTGFVLGISKLVLEIMKDDLSGGLQWFAEINFLHYAIFLFLVCSAVLFAVSLASPAPDPQKVENITFSKGSTSVVWDRGTKIDALLTGLLILGVIGIWIWFR